MKITLITAVPPLPMTEGMRFRTTSVAMALAKLGELHICVVSSAPIAASDREQTLSVFPRTEFSVVNATLKSDGLSAVRRFFDPAWIQGRANQVSAEVSSAIQKQCTNSDVVWVHYLSTADRTGILRFPHSVLDFDDLVSEKTRSLLVLEPGALARLKLQYQIMLWRKWERQAFNRFSAFTVCSEEDASILPKRFDALTVPNTINPETPHGTFEPERTKLILGFIGLLNFPPNRDGLVWFIRDVFPLIRQMEPDCELRVVGRGSVPPEITNVAGIHVIGYMDNPTIEMQQWRAAIVPIRFGGGTRLKTIDSLWKGVPLVSTSLGVYGQGFEHDKDVLIGDTPHQFAERCLTLLRRPEIGKRLVASGQHVIRSRFTWPCIEDMVQAAVGRALSGKSSPC